MNAEHPSPGDKAPVAAETRDKVFISYSHKDQYWLTVLVDLLDPLVRNGSVKVWSDEDIEVGQHWRSEIAKSMASAKVAVLLVSHHFLASTFIVEEELPTLLLAHEQRQLHVVWIAVGASMYGETALAEIQAANSPETPLNTLPEPMAMTELVRIAKAIKRLSNME